MKYAAKALATCQYYERRLSAIYKGNA